MKKHLLFLTIALFLFKKPAQAQLVKTPITPQMERLLELEKRTVLDYLFALPSKYVYISEYLYERELDGKDDSATREKLLHIKNIPSGYLEYNAGLNKGAQTLRTQIVLFKDRTKARDIIAVTQWDCRFTETCGMDYDFLEFDNSICQWRSVKKEIFPNEELLVNTIAQSGNKRSRLDFAGNLEGVLLDLPEKGTTVTAALRQSYKDLECDETNKDFRNICEEPYLELFWKNGRFGIP